MALYGIAFIVECIFSPYFLVYLVISEYVPPVHHQQVEKVILFHREADLFAATVYLPAVRVNLKPWY